MLIPFLFLCLPVHSQSIPSIVRSQIDRRIPHVDVAIAFRTLDGKSEFFYQADESFHAASTKIPVMIELFHQVQEGKLQLDDKILIHNEFHSIVEGSGYKLKPVDDSEIAL